MSELMREAAAPSVDTTDRGGLRAVPDLVAPVQVLGTGVLGLSGEDSDLDQDMVVRRRVQVTHDVVTLVLAPTVGAAEQAVSFAPGQFLTLGAEIEGRVVERCYTISSPPTRPHLLTITVKRVPGGEMSTHLHDVVAAGDRLRVSGPRGSFSVREHPAARYLLLSAGSGITPTLATLRTLADLGDLDGDPGCTDVVVVHSARSAEDLVCRTELDALAATHAGLTVHWVCEDTAGRLGSTLLAALVPDAAVREVLTCGPPGYMAATRVVLAEIGADPARCHEESFVLGAAGAPPVVVDPAPVAPPATPAAYDGIGAVALAPTVRFARSGREVSCAPGQTVLDAATVAGVSLASSCGEGLCGTCKLTLLGGKVEMNHQGGIRPREIDRGGFLPCCSTPDGDIEVEA